MTHYFIPLFLFFWKYDILQVLFKYGSNFQFSHRNDSVSEWPILRGRDHPWYTHGLDNTFLSKCYPVKLVLNLFVTRITYTLTKSAIGCQAYCLLLVAAAVLGFAFSCLSLCKIMVFFSLVK